MSRTFTGDVVSLLCGEMWVRTATQTAAELTFPDMTEQHARRTSPQC